MMGRTVALHESRKKHAVKPLSNVAVAKPNVPGPKTYEERVEQNRIAAESCIRDSRPN